MNMDAITLLFFVKEATGMDYQYLVLRKEMAKHKPDPFELSDPSKDLHRKHVKGLKGVRIATPRPKMQGVKTKPLNISGNPRTRLGMKEAVLNKITN